MLKKIAIGLAAALAVFLIVVATRPASFRIERTRTLNAPPKIVFSLVNDFHQWPKWSPWEKLDPAMTKEFAGSASGEGAVYSWSGNDDVGEGRMTVLSSKPSQAIEIKLEFLKPWTATNLTRFTFAPAGDATTVNWAMEGTNDFMGKAVSIFMDMDAMVGKDFEAGLVALGTAAEAEAKKRAVRATAE